jgi:[protein-PII] uridylyltransferase
LSKEDTRHLVAAYEYLMRIRVDLHFAAHKSQDVLNRDEQLRIAEKRGINGHSGQRPVERFMQTYFRHCRRIALIVDRFLVRHQPRTLSTRVLNFAMAHRAEGKYWVSSRGMDVLPRFRQQVLGSLEEILRLYHCGMLYGLAPVPELADALKQAVAKLPDRVSPESAEVFTAILGRTAHLGRTLRGLYETGVLERLIPDMAHARCLLQFNQYHSYTVDEHTLRAVEAVTRYESIPGPLGNAYRAIQRKEILHLAILLHDLGKGYEEDHSEVGKSIAERVAARLNLPEHRGQNLVFLVHQHLKMAHLAFRRDISDPAILLPFSHSVGSPDTLRMLFVLTAADITAVGPGVWTDWKADLLAELYDGTMHVLSGRRLQHREEQRLKVIKEHLQTAIVPLKAQRGEMSVGDWISRQLDAFPQHYINAYSPEQIASDLDVIQRLEPGEFFLDGEADSETGTVTYRLITHEKSAAGCFHRTVGVLTAKRLEILSADISTSLDGYVVDRYRVIDRDYEGPIPQSRIEDITQSIRGALKGETHVKPLFRRNTRFQLEEPSDFSELPLRVVVDNNTSPRCTVIDVFAHDRPGLLYTATRAIFRMGLSVMLAKIATHLDQVVDVFYVTDANGEKIHDGDRIRKIREELFQTIQEFEQDGYLQFK